MAEAIAVISFVSAIAGLVDISCRVVKRLNDFHSKGNEVPKALQHVKEQLPLVIDSIKRTEEKSKSGYVNEETQKALIPALKGCKEIILRLDEKLENILPLENDSSWDRTRKALQSVNQEKDFQRLFKELDRYLSIFTLHNSSDSKIVGAKDTRISPVFMIPTMRDLNFVDRPGLFEELESNLTNYGRAALAGIGGAGKTQIAIEYCYRFREKNPHAQVFWVHLGTITKFSQGCKTITRRLELPGWDDPQTNNLQQFYDWLNNDKNGQWLLVLDNVDEITFLETPLQLQNNSVRINEFISRSALGAILITTRDKMIGERLAVRGRTVEVLTMAMKEARQLVNFRLSTLPTTEASDREDLIKELNYLPLGITQATAYIIEKCITVKQYLSIFHDGDEEMLELLSENISDDRRIDQESHSVFRTWKLSYDQITKQNPRAAEILSLMSMLDRQEIPSSVIKKDGESTRVFLSAIAVLQNFSLVSKSANGENYGMHRLVQFSTRAWLKVQGAAFNWKSEALFILASKFPSGEFETWRACESLLPHVRLILQEELNGDDYYLKRAELLKKVAWFDRLQGRYEIAISEIQEAHDIFVRLYDNEHSEALSCLTTKADCLIENDDYSIAEGLLRDISVTQERILGPFHPESLRTAGNLAYALYALGIYQESEELHRKTLIGRERELGSRHASTLMSMNNLALVLEARGKLSETEDLHRKTLALREKVHGVDHPLVLESQHNLAFVLHNQNKLSEAEDMCRKTLASQEQVLGLDHPNTLRSRFTLASILNDCGKYEEAEELHRSLIVSGEKNLGSSRFATILNNAAACLSHQSKHQEAEELGRRSLSLWEQTRGINHVETANTRYSVAYFLFVQGKIKEAAQLYRDVLAMKGNVEESKDGIRWESLMKGAKRELENCIKQLSSISNEEIPLSDETTADNFSHDDNDKGLDQDSSTVLPLRRDRN